MAEEESGFDEPDPFAEPNPLKENMPLYALYGATGFTVLLFLGTFIWLQFPSEAIEAELRAMRPNLTKKVPSLRRSARGAAAEKAAATEGGDDEKLRVPSAPRRKSAVLHPHPDPKLVERTDIGMLPIVGADGRRPWRVYSRPFNVLEKRPKVAIVVTGLGVSFNATESVVGILPGEVTLAFAPFARKLKDWIDTARGAGHEVLINLPMEPRGYPRDDPGPFGLLTALDTEQNRRRLDWVLSRMTGYVGVTNYMGGRFTANQSAMRPVLREMERRGLMFLDSMETAASAAPKLAPKLRLPFAMNDKVIDRVVSRTAIDAALAEIERIAKARGSAVALAHPYPATVRRLQRWVGGLDEKGLVLAPITAVVAKQKPR
ncbi:MAG: divergent polysaccharide deacetylase family protein [Rhodospirillaceae bacterium]|nr:divergent polysaccharide deacetylase family protein [Rhodospirillaceae bacterium]